MFKSINLLLTAVVGTIIKLLTGVDHFSAAFANIGKVAEEKSNAFVTEAQFENQLQLEELEARREVHKAKLDLASKTIELPA